MKNDQKFASVILHINNEDEMRLAEDAVNEFDADGIEEFSLDEQTVDNIIGEDSFTSSGLDEKSFNEIMTFIKEERRPAGQLIKVYFCKNDFLKRAEAYQAWLERKGKKAEKIISDWDDWNKNWRQYYAPIKVDDDLMIVPEWEKEKFQKDHDKNIYIYPGMGFGTGDHETTYLCLKLFNKYRKDKKYKKILDFGCGSGILAISAIKMDAQTECDFCDIDTRALDNSVQNLHLNFNDSGIDLSKHRLVSRERFDFKKKYDLVFANILKPVLLEEYHNLNEVLLSGSHIIISGILNEQVQDILSCYQDFIVVEEISKNAWSALLLEKK